MDMKEARGGTDLGEMQERTVKKEEFKIWVVYQKEKKAEESDGSDIWETGITDTYDIQIEWRRNGNSRNNRRQRLGGT